MARIGGICCNPRIQEAETGKSQVQDHPRLHNETLSQKQNSYRKVPFHCYIKKQPTM
jgi:hypothetical protein